MTKAAADNSANETALVARAKDGDAEAFAALVMKYQDRVYNVCYRLCNHHADALDAAQNAFLKAWEAMPRYEARASFFTWLFRIAVNVVRSRQRAQRRRPALSLHRADEGESDREPRELSRNVDPGADMEQAELQTRLGLALAELDEDYRMAVVLKDIEGLDYAQIAELLDVPLGTVKSRICRGRQMLRAKLEPEDVRRELG